MNTIAKNIEMKPLVIKKEFGSRGEYIITQEVDDNDPYALRYTTTLDNGKVIRLTIYRGGDTDGGSIPNFAKGVFDPLLDPTAHGFIIHDELWRHRVYYKDLYQKLGISFTQTNKIMKEVNKAAGCTWAEQNLTRMAVRWFGYYKWTHPEQRIKDIVTPTLRIDVIEDK